METQTIKFYRSIPNDIPSYGDDFNRALDRLVGGADRWDTRAGHGMAAIEGTSARVQRFEDGPEILSLVLEQLPNYLPLLFGLVGSWLKSRDKAAGEKRTVKIGCGERSFEGPVADEAELKRILDLLKCE